MAGDTRGPDPEWEITSEISEEIKEMAGLMTHQQMYNYFGVSKSKWYKELNKNPQTKNIIKKAKPKKVLKAARCLFDEMDKGGKAAVAAAIFYLKTQGGWSEKKKLEISRPQKPAELPKSLGNDPIAASQTYQKIMGG